MRTRCAGSGSHAAPRARSGDDAGWDELTERQVRLAREAGELSLAADRAGERFSVQLFLGDLVAAAALVVETEAVTAATGSRLAPQGAIALAAWRGHEAEATALIDAQRREVMRRGEGLWLVATEWASAVLFNGLGRYEDALAVAEQAVGHPHELGVSTWVPTELIEAAARSGHPERAAGPLRRLAETARRGHRLGARRRGALARAAQRRRDAERLYRDAIERLGRTRARPRSRVRTCSTASGCDARIGASTHASSCGPHTSCSRRSARTAFAERARRELLATGETVRKRSPETRDSSPPRRRRSRSSPPRAARIPRSARSCSSARARSSGTCARCSRSSASARAGSSARRSSSRPRRRQRPSRSERRPAPSRAMYEQVHDPVGGSLGLSTLFAILPLVTLFALLAGLRVRAYRAGLIALAVALTVAIVVYGMPVGQALTAPPRARRSGSSRSCGSW